MWVIRCTSRDEIGPAKWGLGHSATEDFPSTWSGVSPVRSTSTDGEPHRRVTTRPPSVAIKPRSKGPNADRTVRGSDRRRAQAVIGCWGCGPDLGSTWMCSIVGYTLTRLFACVAGQATPGVGSSVAVTRWTLRRSWKPVEIRWFPHSRGVSRSPAVLCVSVSHALAASAHLERTGVPTVASVSLVVRQLSKARENPSSWDVLPHLRWGSVAAMRYSGPVDLRCDTSVGY